MDQTLKIGWQLARSVTEVDSPLIDAASMDSLPSGVAGIGNRNISGIEMIMAAAGSEGGTVKARIWTGRDGPPARLVAEVVFTLGAMVVNQDPQTDNAITALNAIISERLTTMVSPSTWAAGPWPEGWTRNRSKTR